MAGLDFSLAFLCTVLNSTAPTKTLLTTDGYQIVGGGCGGGGVVGIRDVLFSCDADITLNLVFLLLYADTLYTLCR